MFDYFWRPAGIDTLTLQTRARLTVWVEEAVAMAFKLPRVPTFVVDEDTCGEVVATRPRSLHSDFGRPYHFLGRPVVIRRLPTDRYRLRFGVFDEASRLGPRQLFEIAYRDYERGQHCISFGRVANRFPRLSSVWGALLFLVKDPDPYRTVVAGIETFSDRPATPTKQVLATKGHLNCSLVLFDDQGRVTFTSRKRPWMAQLSRTPGGWKEADASRTPAGYWIGDISSDHAHRGYDPVVARLHENSGEAALYLEALAELEMGVIPVGEWFRSERITRHRATWRVLGVPRRFRPRRSTVFADLWRLPCEQRYFAGAAELTLRQPTPRRRHDHERLQRVAAEVGIHRLLRDANLFLKRPPRNIRGFFEASQEATEVDTQLNQSLLSFCGGVGGNGIVFAENDPPAISCW